jgi:hypothetical protein
MRTVRAIAKSLIIVSLLMVGILIYIGLQGTAIAAPVNH